MWLTCKADHAWTAGRSEIAYDLARRAITEPTHGQLHRRNVSGIARWLAVLNEAGVWEDRYDEIANRVGRTQAASWWDEAERLCALKRLGRRFHQSFDVASALENALARLPNVIEQHLTRYGLGPR